MRFCGFMLLCSFVMADDSLDTVELVMAFEEEFGSEISDSEAEKILDRRASCRERV